MLGLAVVQSSRKAPRVVLPQRAPRWWSKKFCSSRTGTEEGGRGRGSGGLLVAERMQDVGVLKLTLNRPEQRNALNFGLLKELEKQFELCQRDGCNELRVVMLEANGPMFCSGHDLKEMMSEEGNNMETQKELFELCSNVMTLVKEIPQPVVAATHGMATAAGAQLAASCDYVVSSPSCKFQTPGVMIGLFCSTPAVSIVRSIGEKAAMDMLLTGRAVDSEEALRWGLISEISPSDEDVKDVAFSRAVDIAKRSGRALAIGKRAFYQQAREGDLKKAYDIASDAMTVGMRAYDAQEGIDAFLSKRKPTWKNK